MPEKSSKFPDPLIVFKTPICKKCYTELMNTLVFDSETNERVRTLFCYKCGSYYEYSASQPNPPEKGGEIDGRGKTDQSDNCGNDGEVQGTAEEDR